MKNFLTICFCFFILTSSAIAKDMRFAQISDVRFAKDSETHTLQKVINDINKQKDIDFVIFTGDNICKPSIDDLGAFLKQANKLKAPFYVVIGDKDVNKHKKLSKIEYCKYLKKNIKKYKPETPNFSFEKNGVAFVVVDGSKDVIPSINGFFKEDVLIWFDNELNKYPKNNIIVFQHFPVIPPTEKESYYTYKPEGYLEIIKKHENVKAIISGHFGVNSEMNVDNVTHITTAGLPSYRIIDILDYDTQNPTIWAELKNAE